MKTKSTYDHITASRTDLIGKRFNMLTVLKFVEFKNRKSYWLCKCDCGNEKIVSRKDLRENRVKSCGCLRAIENKSRAKHGLAGSKIYNTWRSMLKRCYLPSNPSYKHYGAREINVCDEWRDKEQGFIHFYEWAIANGYKEGLILDRINVNGNYEPTNCRWVTPKVSANNKRNNVPVTIKGVTKNLYEWEKATGIRYQTIADRIKRGWKDEDLLKPPKKRGMIK